MEYTEFYNRKKEILCEICSTDYLSDILQDIDFSKENDTTEKALQQLCELFNYIEYRQKRETKIQLLKGLRKLHQSLKR